MPRTYAPLSNNAALQAARDDALNHWGGGGQHWCGHQNVEYITFDQADPVKIAWRNFHHITVNGTVYETKASDSQSGLANEIDLKLCLPGNASSDFIYHIALDAQQVESNVEPVKLDSLRDAWRIMNNLRRDEYRKEHNGKNPPANFELKFPW